MTGCAGCMPCTRHIQKKPAKPPGQGTDTLFQYRREILLQGNRYQEHTGGRSDQGKGVIWLRS